MDDAFVVWCSLVYKGFGMGWVFTKEEN